MKKIQSLYFLLLLIPLTVVSQNSETYVSFPDVTKIYLSGDCAEVLISDSCNYLFWQEYQKKELVKAISMQKQVDKVVVRFKYTREIWIIREGVASLVSSMDIENFDPFRWQKFTDQVYSKCDFFTYYGLSMDFNLSHFAISFSGRTGCFFFKRFWDLSVNYSYSISTFGSMNTSALSISLMTKFYPFFKTTVFLNHHISPYVGVEGGYYATFVDRKRNDSWDLNGHIGVSWQVGPGSLDFGIQSGRQNLFAATIGYSFCPAMLSHKKIKQ